MYRKHPRAKEKVSVPSKFFTILFSNFGFQDFFRIVSVLLLIGLELKQRSQLVTRFPIQWTIADPVGPDFLRGV